jgi:hypothetical protein
MPEHGSGAREDMRTEPKPQPGRLAVVELVHELADALGEADPGRGQEQLRLAVSLRATALHFEACLRREDLRSNPDEPSRTGWRCKNPLCERCAQIERGRVQSRYFGVVRALAAEIDREDPGRGRRFFHMTLTTQRRESGSSPTRHSAIRPKELLDAYEQARYRRVLAERAFELFRGRVDWFQRPPRRRERTSGSLRGGVWPGRHRRSSVFDSFAVVGWHVHSGHPHLHAVVYGADYLGEDAVQGAWTESFRRAMQGWKGFRPGRPSSVPPWEVDLRPLADGLFTGGGPVEPAPSNRGTDPLARDLRGILGYLVEPGMSDASMLDRPAHVATLLAAWTGKHRTQPYGRLYGRVGRVRAKSA